MSTTTAPLPALESLSDALRALLGQDATILHRRRNLQTSTFPSEIVTCRVAGREPTRLFCKYADEGIGLVAGHRSGVAFEAMVYRDLLSALDVPAVQFYGSYRDPETGATWFFLEALDETARVNKSADPGAMPRAARWAGRLHALGERRAADFRDRLHRYDAAYYAGWPEQTLQCARGRAAEFPGLAPVCERFARLLPRLLDRPQTIIHGEYYPRNILVGDDGAVYPIDWESAAIACGEIDLASLTENWPEATVRACVDEYCRSRWAGGAAPAAFAETLDLARAYLHLRWMGGSQGTLSTADFNWRLSCMKELTARLADAKA
jgi:aminoglycoside phosphotransferase (APT) family kinase protein